MDLDAARQIVRSQNRAVLSTARPDGTPQMSPVTATVDDAGRVIISTTRNTAKVRNMLRDSRAWLCVLPDEFFGRWIQVEGEVEIVEQPDAIELLVDYYRTVAGEHEDWDEYREAMRREGRVLVRVHLTRAGPG